MAQSIEVTATGLHAYGVNCAHHATRVVSAAASPPEVPANPAQATALAVAAIHGAVGTHAAALGDLMALTARAAVYSASQYTDTEETNTDDLAGVV